jgi:UDP-N-acetylmuramoylalanine--D-glutamate ligase
MDLAAKNVVVVGAGKSGLAAARLLAAQGARVVLNDKKAALAAGTEAPAGVTLRLGSHPASIFEAADLVVLSPGVPVLPEVEAARARGAKVWAEIELANRFVSAPLIGITGSNGKSTVTTLVGRMAQEDGPAFVGGNLGDALTLAVGTDAASSGRVIAELSSFQLDDIEDFHCDVAACLNVSADHLDRHGTFAAYAAAKGRVFANQRSNDHAVVPAGDELCLSLARSGAGQIHTFGPGGEVAVVDGCITDEVNGLRFPVADLMIRGLHNQANACAAALIARLAGIPRAAIESVLGTFTGLPHRMVLVRELDAVRYYDDSKATNVGAAVAAIDGLADLSGKIVLIAGGVDKGGSYAPLRERLERMGRALVLIGDATPLLRSAFEGTTLPLHDATSMDEAVLTARRLSSAGDAVLLAPACASFDMFQSYAHRGDVFASAVNALSGGPA